jgi:hypothetical protein
MHDIDMVESVIKNLQRLFDNENIEEYEANVLNPASVAINKCRESLNGLHIELGRIVVREQKKNV